LSVVGTLKPRFGVNDTLHGFSDVRKSIFLRLTSISVVTHQLLVESTLSSLLTEVSSEDKDIKRRWDC
jgi:hypothetical protein